MKNILTEALVNSATNASFIFSYTNFAKLRIHLFTFNFKKFVHKINSSVFKIKTNHLTKA